MQYACISIIGHTPTTTTPKNGVVTPTLIQTGMTKNCETFYHVKPKDNYASIATSYHIPVLSSFVAWNPAVGSSCKGCLCSYYMSEAAPVIAISGRPSRHVILPSIAGLRGWHSGREGGQTKFIVGGIVGRKTTRISEGRTRAT